MIDVHAEIGYRWTVTGAKPARRAAVLGGVLAGVGLCIAIGVIAGMTSNAQLLTTPDTKTPAIVGGLVAAVAGFVLGRRLPKKGAAWGLAIGLGFMGAIGGATIPTAANLWLDGSEPVVHETVVRERGEVEVASRHGKRDRYFVAVDPWPGMGTELVRVWVSVDEIRRMREGQAVLVRVRDGFLGHAWIESIAPP